MFIEYKSVINAEDALDIHWHTLEELPEEAYDGWDLLQHQDMWGHYFEHETLPSPGGMYIPSQFSSLDDTGQTHEMELRLILNSTSIPASIENFNNAVPSKYLEFGSAGIKWGDNFFAELGAIFEWVYCFIGRTTDNPTLRLFQGIRFTSINCLTARASIIAPSAFSTYNEGEDSEDYPVIQDRETVMDMASVTVEEGLILGGGVEKFAMWEKNEYFLDEVEVLSEQKYFLQTFNVEQIEIPGAFFSSVRYGADPEIDESTPWFDDNFKRRKKIVVKKENVLGDHIKIPVRAILKASDGQVAESMIKYGGSIIVVDDNEDVLPTEVLEAKNYKEQAICVFFMAETLTDAKDNVFYVYYSDLDSQHSSGYASAAIWKPLHGGNVKTYVNHFGLNWIES